jgi:hypothetical protein
MYITFPVINHHVQCCKLGRNSQKSVPQYLKVPLAKVTGEQTSGTVPDFRYRSQVLYL